MYLFRVGGKENFFHCSRCDICLGTQLRETHKVGVALFSNASAMNTCEPNVISSPSLFGCSVKIKNVIALVKSLHNKASNAH